MSYYFAKTIEAPFDEAVARTIDALKHNASLGQVAAEVQAKLKRVVEQI